MSKKLYYTWEDFDRDIENIKNIFDKNNYYPKAIFGIPKGGLVLAVRLANLYEIPLFLDLIEANKEIENKKDILLVDDISDKGDTLKKIPYYRCYTTLTIFIRSTTKCRPTYFLQEIFDKRWVVFSWENTINVKEERDGTVI